MAHTISAPSNGHTPDRGVSPALHQIAEALTKLRYGQIQLTVHDGRVVQLEVTEKQRFT